MSNPILVVDYDPQWPAKPIIDVDEIEGVNRL